MVLQQTPKGLVMLRIVRSGHVSTTEFVGIWCETSDLKVILQSIRKTLNVRSKRTYDRIDSELVFVKVNMCVHLQTRGFCSGWSESLIHLRR